MFFRTKIVKHTPVLQLVDSYRNEEGQPRQRIVASLGNAQLPPGKKRTIAHCVQQRLCGQRELFDSELTGEVTEWVDRIVRMAEHARSVQIDSGQSALDGVLADQIETLNVVEFGPELVGMKAWRSLGLTEKLLEWGMNRRAASLAQVVVINRLVEPLSEWALIEWVERTALPECLNVRISKSTKDRLYKTSDELMVRRRKMEEHLRRTEESLFGLNRSIVLYDVTNTHFEGLCQSNPKAARGKNKQRRNDCLQVAVGIAFDEYGFSLAHEVFEGNMADSKTLGRMLDRLSVFADQRHKPVAILDAGIANADNLQMLRERGYAYLVNITRGTRARYAEYFDQPGFEALPGRNENEQVKVRSIADPDHPEDQLILCRSMKRREKERAMLSTAEKRFLKDAEALRKRVAEGRLKNPDKILRAIGRMIQKHPRISRFYQVDITDHALRIERKESKMTQAYELCGDYVLRTERTFAADTLWYLYMTLLKAEEGFKMLKGTLGLRPNFHQKENRVEGHIFISVLAYHLLCWIRAKTEAAGDRRTWRTLRRILRTHCLATTRFPLNDGRVVSVRKASAPDEGQVQIYRMLGIEWRNAYKPRKTAVSS